MIKFSLYALAPLAALLSAPAVNAQNCGACSQCQQRCGENQGPKYHDSFYMNQVWPRPYMAPARRGICQAFALTVDNGWRRNNLLGKYDFDPKGENGLSEAGRIRVEWILTQAPQQRRTIFVQRGLDQQETTQRVEAVQALAANMYPSTGPADVQETMMQDYGRPAAAVDAVFTGFGANQPLPVLPSSNSPGQGATGTGS